MSLIDRYQDSNSWRTKETFFDMSHIPVRSTPNIADGARPAELVILDVFTMHGMVPGRTID